MVRYKLFDVEGPGVRIAELEDRDWSRLTKEEAFLEMV